MKTLLATLSIAILAGCSAYATPVAKRTPNGGVEYYTNSMVGEGTPETGCYLPWRAAGHATLGHNPKLVHYSDGAEFFDCKIDKKVVAIKESTPVVVVPAPAVVERTPAPVVVPEPMPPVAVPASAPMTTKPIRQ